MEIILGIALTLAVFLVVVVIHELGHFFAAKWSGVRVDEFGVGLPPRAKTLYRDRSGTEYTLNWLAIGGFVRLHGEDVAVAEEPDRAFSRAGFFQKLAIIFAGVAMNFLLAAAIFAGLFMW